MALSYSEGFLSEVYVAGIIARSKYLNKVKSPWTVPQLLKLAQQSSWLASNARKWMHSRSFDKSIPADTLDSVYGVDFLVEVEGELIAIDLTTNDEKADEKLRRLRESAQVLPVVDKWCVLVWDTECPLTEQDLLDVYLSEDRFQLVYLTH